VTIADASSLPAVTVIIPAFNKMELTRQCLCALGRLQDPVPCEVVVVDNASADGTPAMLRGFPWVRTVRNEENLGFAKACNQGARIAKGRHLVFLNNDTIPLDHWLEPLVKEVEADRRVGMVGSRLLYENGTVQHAGVAFSRQTRIPYHPYRFMPSNAPCVNRRKEMQAVTAACVLIPRETFTRMEGFCEDYRNGWEDLDLCVRLRLASMRIIYQPQSCLYHLESQSPGRMDRDDENKARFFQKWQGLLLSDEDAHYLQDGACMGWIRGGRGAARIRPLHSERERAQWSLPAQVQRSAAEADIPAMRAALEDAPGWPADPQVLSWAGLIAHSLGLKPAARQFMERAQAIQDSLEVRIWMATLLGLEGVLPDGAGVQGKALALKAAKDAEARGESLAALHGYERALDLGGGSREALEGLLNSAAALGDEPTRGQAAVALEFLGAGR